MTSLVRTWLSICFHERPYFLRASRKSWCSSSVQFSRFFVITYFLRCFFAGGELDVAVSLEVFNGEVERDFDFSTELRTEVAAEGVALSAGVFEGGRHGLGEGCGIVDD